MKDFIDFSNIPKDGRGKNSWKNSLNCLIPFCYIWNNGLKNTKLISEQLNVARGTAIEYLKKGAKLNLCDYITAYQLKKI